MRWGVLFATFFTVLPAPPTRAETVERWYQATSPHFTVLSDGGEKPAREVAGDLERFRSAFEKIIGARVEGYRPLCIFAADGERSMRRLVPWYWERRGGVRPVGVFLGGSAEDWVVLRADVPRSTQVIVHEYTHVLTRLSMGPLPTWLNEGLAQVYSAGRIEPDAIYVGETLSSWQVALLRRATLIPVADLMAVTEGSSEYRNRKGAGVFYAESFLLTHYLLLEGNGRHRAAVDTFRHLLEDGATEREALSRAFGGPEALDKELRDYLAKGWFPYGKVATERSDQSIAVRQLAPAEAAAMLAEFMLCTGQLRHATEQIAEALTADRSLGTAQLQRGVLLLQQGQREDATVAFAEARERTPGDLMAQYRFATLGRGPRADACSREEALRAAIRIAPAFAPAHEALAKLLIEGERSPGEAVSHAREAVRLEPGSARYRLTLLDVETRVGDDVVASMVERSLQRASRIDYSALAGLASYYERHFAPEKAECLLRTVREQNPHDLGTVVMLAYLLKSQGWLDESDAVLRAALAREPHDPSLMNGLAYLEAERGVRLDEALALADEALKLRPSDPDIQDTKAWVLVRFHRYPEAEALERQSLEIADQPTVREHLGDILERRGYPNEAAAEWRRVLADDEISDEHRDRLEAKIAKSEGATTPH